MKRYFAFVLLFATAAQASNCKISILNEKYNGEKVRLTFHSRLNSKDECAALARMHRPNVMTREVRRKSVTYQWETDSEIVNAKKRSRKNY